MCEKVYKVRVSVEEDRPWWLELENNLSDDTRINNREVLLARAPASEYVPERYVVRQSGADEWHFYSISYLGLLSQAAVELLHDAMSQCFEFLPAWINGYPYFAPRPIASLDALDHANSVVRLYCDEPPSIMDIKKFRFHKNRIFDPIVFVIPDITDGFFLSEIFVTESVKTMIESKELKGFEFLDAEQP